MHKFAIVIFAAACGASPAQAFDCARAVAPIDKAICGDDEARDANERMEKAYVTLRAGLGGEGRKILLDGQRAWIGYRDERCGTGPDCLAEQSGERADALAATPAGMAPFFLWQAGVDDGYAVRLAGYRFTGDFGRGEAAYNRWLDSEIADSPYGDPLDEDEHQAYEWEVDFTVNRLTERLISAVGWLYAYTGGAHPNSGTSGFLADRKTGEDLSAAALFDREALARLREDCSRQILEAQNDTYGEMEPDEALKALEESYPGVVRDTIADMRRWHVEDDKVVVRFDSYGIAPYAAGPQECVFDRAAVARASADPGLFE